MGVVGMELNELIHISYSKQYKLTNILLFIMSITLKMTFYLIKEKGRSRDHMHLPISLLFFDIQKSIFHFP